MNATKPWRDLRVMPHVTGTIIRIMAEEYSMDSVVRGHHVCKTIWSPILGEELQCHQETGNIHDLHVVAMIKPGTGIVDHVQREYSTLCNAFIRGGGIIICIITGN